MEITSQEKDKIVIQITPSQSKTVKSKRKLVENFTDDMDDKVTKSLKRDGTVGGARGRGRGNNRGRGNARGSGNTRGRGNGRGRGTTRGIGNGGGRGQKRKVNQRKKREMSSSSESGSDDINGYKDDTEEEIVEESDVEEHDVDLNGFLPELTLTNERRDNDGKQTLDLNLEELSNASFNDLLNMTIMSEMDEETEIREEDDGEQRKTEEPGIGNINMINTYVKQMDEETEIREENNGEQRKTEEPGIKVGCHVAVSHGRNVFPAVVCSDMCVQILSNKQNLELNMIRLFSTHSTRCLNIGRMFDNMEIQLDYTNTVLALVQVLPNLVNTEWENCFCFIGHMLRLNNLSVPYKKQDTEVESVICYSTCTELKQSQILHDVTLLLQYTDVGQNKLSLYHYLKCYIRYLNEFVIKDGDHLQNSTGQRSYILSEVFSHVVTAIWWMDESDSEPCNVILLDIVCSLEDEIIKDRLKKSLIHSVDDYLNLIKNADTSSMIGKKVMEILKLVDCEEK